MKKKCFGLVILWMLVCSAISAEAQLSIGIGLPNVSIGINLPLYPELVPVPGYPVYYAPQVNGNYFFYDGMYWVYQNDNWYASSWYNGPWGFVEPAVVPLFILRIPVNYYRQPPEYFRGWRSNAPPRWGQHWGRGWEQRHSGWDRWNRGSAPTRAPLPVYQRQYSGDRYPTRVEQQHELRGQSYRYQPRDKVVRQHFQQQGGQKTPATAERRRQEAPQTRNPREQHAQPPQQGAPAATRSQPQQRGGESDHKPGPVQPATQQRGPESRDQRQQPAAVQHEQREQQAPKPHVQEQRHRERDKESQEPGRERGQGQNRDDERGKGRN